MGCKHYKDLYDRGCREEAYHKFQKWCKKHVDACKAVEESAIKKHCPFDDKKPTATPPPASLELESRHHHHHHHHQNQNVNHTREAEEWCGKDMKHRIRCRIGRDRICANKFPGKYDPSYPLPHMHPIPSTSTPTLHQRIPPGDMPTTLSAHLDLSPANTTNISLPIDHHEAITPRAQPRQDQDAFEDAAAAIAAAYLAASHAPGAKPLTNHEAAAPTLHYDGTTDTIFNDANGLVYVSEDAAATAVATDIAAICQGQGQGQGAVGLASGSVAAIAVATAVLVGCLAAAGGFWFGARKGGKGKGKGKAKGAAAAMGVDKTKGSATTAAAVGETEKGVGAVGAAC
ncbi:hypothetical protein BS50DRAFT_639627 [Corynespora cassiicola Philippines]|uniref:Uncharacterized protein n=1 Tax=Corynespora cassiicola Philippines TaxID=1448308 RepID=A0A2T2N6D3_CORCC|nr:hypothetical protein BS50DRAFT_639627 [Corynespora cassiicola Philippines]